MTRLAVLGAPIAHSKSPLLHAAAYRELGLDWEYSAVEVDSAELPSFVAAMDAQWRGLSLTMPLKRDILPLLSSAEELVDLTGVANTVHVGDGLRGFNTDIYGIAQAFRETGVVVVSNVLLLGGGATAASAMVAIAQLGGARVVVAVRDPTRVDRLAALGRAMGLVVDVERLDALDAGFAADAVISTLPGGVDSGVQFDVGLRGTAVLLDVAYDPWPSALVKQWQAVGGRVIPGIEMLVSQAVMQVRIFVSGDPDRPLAGESTVIERMREAVGLAPVS